MEKIKVKDLKRGAMFWLIKDYEKHGDNEKYLRVRGEYDRSIKKYYTERPYHDAIGNGRYLSGDLLVCCEENTPTIFKNYI